jgi:hypothetical protein
MAWYKSGTVSVTNGSTTVTGSGTSWVTGVGVGEAFYGPDGRIYEIANIISATQLTLGSNYLGSTVSGQAYQIVPTQSYIRDLAAEAASLVQNYGSVMSSAGLGLFGDGTLAEPGVRFSGDTNTGIRRVTTDTVAIVTNALDRVTVNTTGASVTGNLSATGTLAATGAATLSSTLAVTGATTLSGNLQVDGNTTLGNASGDTLTVHPNAVTWSNPVTHSNNHTFSGSVTVNGNTTIGDASGDTLTFAPSAVTWSNNPTHSGNHTYSGNVTVNGNATLGDSTSLDAHVINGVVDVNANTATAAFTITQTGAGNAFVVEDSASPDSTPFVIDAAGRVTVGHTAQVAPVSGLAAGVGVHSTASQGNHFSAFQWSADSLQPFVTLSKSRGTTPGTQGAVANLDAIGTIIWTASDGTNFVQAARIEAIVDGAPGTNDMPTLLRFSTTADGQATPTERYRINNAGNHFFGNTTTNTNSTLMVVNGEISETSGGTQYKLVNQSDVGTAPNEVPLNQFLGTMAFRESPLVPVPASATATGNVGDIAANATHIFVCIAPNTWVRASAGTW